MTGLTPRDLADLLLAVADRMISAEQVLGVADREIGDGDHGRGMARGFEAAQKALQHGSFLTGADVFQTVGDALLETMGGASGVVFGTMLRGDGGTFIRTTTIDTDGLAAHFEEALDRVKSRGGARVGDKTMVDALEPATIALRIAADRGIPVPAALAGAAAAAADGCERTRNLTAQFGKAATLGDRAVGHIDPGALSVAIIFDAMAERAGAAPTNTALTRLATPL